MEHQNMDGGHCGLFQAVDIHTHIHLSMLSMYQVLISLAAYASDQKPCKAHSHVIIHLARKCQRLKVNR